MNIRLSLLAAAIAISTAASSQTVSEGKKFLYYERWKSARETFERIVNSNPNNAEAVYWLGQVLITQPGPDVARAKEVYQKALQANGNSPLLWVAMGHIELLDGKNADARQRFETAINVTKGKDAMVLNAIGRANIDAKSGDKNYGIEKAKLAAEKDNKNPEYHITVGDGYRKLIEGGEAQSAYQRAYGIDPNHAQAYYKIGKIFVTQKNYEVFLPLFEKSISLDANFAPSYLALYEYYSYRNVEKARVYLDKYISTADKDVDNDIYFADFLFKAGKNQESLDKVNAIEAANPGAKLLRLNIIRAYNYDRLGDSLAAKNALDLFFAAEEPAKILLSDYEIAAKVYGRVPGSEAKGIQYLQMAFNQDSVYETKLGYLQKMAEIFKRTGDKASEATTMGKIYAFKKTPAKRDLYDWGFAYYSGGNFMMADSIFGMYASKYPDETYGHLWRARACKKIDTTMKMGKAVPYYIRLTEVAAADKVTNKNALLEAYGYLAAYSQNIKSDSKSALDYLNRYLEIDPENAEVKKVVEQLKKAGPGAPRPPAANPGGTRPAPARGTGARPANPPKPTGATKPAKTPGKTATAAKS